MNRLSVPSRPCGYALVMAVATLVAGSGPAFAQSDTLRRFERRVERIERERAEQFRAEVPAGQRALFEYGGYFSARFFAIDDLAGSTSLLRSSNLTLYARANLDNAHKVFLRGQVTYHDFNDGESFDNQGDQWEGPELERGYYRFNLREAVRASGGTPPSFNVRASGGRRLVHWGNGLVLSRTLDGASVSFVAGDLTITGIAGRTWEEITGIDSSRPGFDNETRRAFYGGKLSYSLTPHHRPFVYGLVQEDHNRDRPLRFAGTTTRFDYDSHYIGVGSRGDVADNWTYGLEFAFQGGEGLSFGTSGAGVRQTREDIDAWGLDLRTDYFLDSARRTRILGELLLATGDEDRGHTTNTFNGNAPGTDDEAFNAFGLVNTGLAFGPNASNLAMLRLGANTYPLPGEGIFDRLQIGAELFGFHKLEDDAPIDEPTTNDGYLGVEADLYANWKLTSDLSLNTRYGVFFPGEAIVPANDGARHFAMTGLTLGF